MDISSQNLDTTEITIRNKSKTDAKNLWKENEDDEEYQIHATIFSTDSTTESDETISFLKKVNIMDLEKRKEVYGVCGECNEPGTGWCWCKPCNAKRFKENFKNWTSGNKNIDEFIQQSQLNSLFCTKSLEWIPFEKFEDVTYLTRGGFSKIYSAYWSEGNIVRWDIENQEWIRTSRKVALKSLNNSSNNISNDFLNEIKYYISSHFHTTNTVMCFGITQDPVTKDYMMVLDYYEGGNLRNTFVKGLDYKTKIRYLFCILDGLSGIHDAGNIHKDFHSGNILHDNNYDILSISDLGMCQPINNGEQSVKKGIYGVLSYMAPEVLHGCQYTKAADIYSFGIIMNEIMSDEITYNDISHDNNLAVKICKGFRPKISEDTPKLIADLIIKYKNSEISYQIKECEKIKENKLKNRKNENQSKNLQTHPQAIYTSRLLNFENLPEPVNSTDYLSSFQEPISSSSVNPISECLDCELNELDLNQDDDE
ncbi:kinase-like domain-containing protein, partial [Rhizophagus diaphanus]